VRSEHRQAWDTLQRSAMFQTQWFVESTNRTPDPLCFSAARGYALILRAGRWRGIRLNNEHCRGECHRAFPESESLHNL
jgi:hypothetical protein